jgi:NADH-quinone oxidoreductase subunit G
VQGKLLSNRTDKAAWLGDTSARPVTASIYQLDGVVRRATSLQLTADARVAQARREEVAA